jgi:hypothetical protein
MIELADIFRHHGPAYRAKFADRLLPRHRAALEAIEHCRTAALGGASLPVHNVWRTGVQLACVSEPALPQVSESSGYTLSGTAEGAAPAGPILPG